MGVFSDVTNHVTNLHLFLQLVHQLGGCQGDERDGCKKNKGEEERGRRFDEPEAHTFCGKLMLA